MKTRPSTRRAFLQTALCSAAPLILPSRVLGQMAPSRRITVAMIGTGRQAMHSNLPWFLNCETTQVVAVCDVDRWRLQEAKTKVDQHYRNSACRTYTDWREVLARDDIDAIMNSTADHWHVPIALAAVRRGKHVSCEKPLTLSVNEGRALAAAAKRHGVTFATDSECRSHAYMHKTAELVRNGYIGQIQRIEVGVPTGDVAGGDPTPTQVPAELDYEMWMGPAPLKPYCLDRVHPRQSFGRPGWMRCRDTCEGMITNWGTHTLDVAQLVNNTERTGPVSVECTGKYPAPGSGLWGVLLSFRAQFKYGNGVILDYFTADHAYVRVEGAEGWIHANWTGKGGLQASKPELLRLKLKAGDLRLPPRSEKVDFVYGITERAPTMADAEVGHRTCSLGQIAHIAIQRAKRLAWDPQAERFTNDDGANALLSRPCRAPWKPEGA
jgi:predicted dehydrogenase